MVGEKFSNNDLHLNQLISNKNVYVRFDPKLICTLYLF